MPDQTPADRPDLPIQPTGSGVADTEIAMMQAAVAPETEEIDPDEGPTDTRA